MRCSDVRELISSFVDKELSPDESKNFNAHVASCASCRKELDDSIRISKLMSNIDEIEPQENFIERFYEKVRNNKKESILDKIFGIFDRYVFLKPALGFAAAVSIIIGGSYYISQIEKVGTDQSSMLQEMNLDEEEIISIAGNIELFSEFDLIENLDGIENIEIVEQLDSLLDS
jgi:hypothetical protein